MKDNGLIKKAAVIDLGSNSVRMSVFGWGADKKPVTLESYRKTIKLSEGMTADMRLDFTAQMRAARALKEYKELLAKSGTRELYAVATAAVRKAENRAEFLKLVKELADIEIRVIDGKQEAALDMLAIKRYVGCDRGVICDVGGGSTELIGMNGAEEPLSVSIPFGSRGIYEMFFSEGETEDAIKRAESFAAERFGEVPWLERFSGSRVIGVGGTLRAAAMLDSSETRGASAQKHEISTEKMRGLIEKVLSASPKEREKMVGIGKERADIIGGGLVFVKCLLTRLAPSGFTVVDVGVREGVMLDALENGGIL